MKKEKSIHKKYDWQQIITLITVALFFITAFISCDDRLEAIKELSAKPTIILEAQRTGVKAKYLTDSAKVSNNIATYYPFGIEVDDPFGNIGQVTMHLLKGSGELYYQDEQVKGNVPVLGNKGYFKFFPKTIGDVWVSFVVTGQRGTSDSAIIRLTVIDNLLPVAMMKATPDKTEDDYGYMFDASASYDADKLLKGEVIKYIFTIAGRKIETNTPIVKHIFSRPGTYIITLQVMDNDEALSPEITQTITIE